MIKITLRMGLYLVHHNAYIADNGSYDPSLSHKGTTMWRLRHMLYHWEPDQFQAESLYAIQSDGKLTSLLHLFVMS